MKIISFVMLFQFGRLWHLCITIAESSNSKQSARKSEPIRRLLVKYYESIRALPQRWEMSLKELDLLKLVCAKAAMWNEWSYTSYDPDEYNMWTYPSKWSRQSLWLKFRPLISIATKTGCRKRPMTTLIFNHNRYRCYLRSKSYCRIRRVQAVSVKR